MMYGTEDLTGQHRGTLLVERAVSLRPLRWHVRCEVCGTSFQVDHMRLQNGAVNACPNNLCGKTPAVSRSTSAQTGQRVEAIRSRDTESARDFHQQEQHIVWGQPSTEGMLNADPDSLRRFLDYEENKHA